VLLNTELPDMSGEIVCRRIYRHCPETRCFFLMNQVHWLTLSRLVDSPDKGFLTKDACYLTLEAVKVISIGKTYLQPDLALDLIRYRENPPIRSLNKLSSHEQMRELICNSPKL
jgi:DNA-binding NarL/FixJ family response regulator